MDVSVTRLGWGVWGLADLLGRPIGRDIRAQAAFVAGLFGIAA
jgi:hypothetical protein